MLDRQIYASLRMRPGRTCAELAVEHQAPTALVSASLRVLRARGLVKSSGNTKGTRWAPATKKATRK